MRFVQVGFILAIASFVTAEVDKYALRELHVLFQKADQNLDRFLDKTELHKFVTRFVKRSPSVYHLPRINKDADEAGMLLADELFQQADKDSDGRLSYRGTLLRKSDAINFGELVEKVLINLVHEISDKSPPFPDVNPFAHDRVKRNTQSTVKPIITEKHGIATIRELPNPLGTIQLTSNL
uniref:EF-hand domain-containing protein n=1 Tax=Panagrellus redivivus TaxID=6233 RepID=A0A7E4ZT67_PANRE